MSKEKVIKTMSVSALLAGAMICTNVLNENAQKAQAATDETPIHTVATVQYNGKGKVRLLDGNGQWQDQYVANNTRWKTFAKATIRNMTMYRLGTDKQWIPAQYTDLPEDVTPADTTVNTSVDTSKAATNRQPLHTVGYTHYDGAGKIRLLDDNGQWQEQYVDKGRKYKVFEQATIRNQTMYRIGTNQQWIPSAYFTLETPYVTPTYSVYDAGISDSASVTTNTPASTDDISSQIMSNYKNIFGTNSNTDSSSVVNNIPTITPNIDTATPESSATITDGAHFWEAQPYIIDSNGNATEMTSDDVYHFFHPTPKPVDPNEGMWSQAQIEEAERYFFDYINKERIQRGLQPFENGNNVSWIRDGVKIRVAENKQLVEEGRGITHQRPNGTSCFTAFNKSAGGFVTAECLGQELSQSSTEHFYSETPQQAATNVAQSFIAEGPNGGHYQALMTPSKNIYMGVAFAATHDPQAGGSMNYIAAVATATMGN